jgi:hypothetical protein
MLFGLLFDSEDRGNAFLRNVDRYLPDYTASHNKIYHFFTLATVRTSNPAWMQLAQHRIQYCLSVKEHEKES